MLYLFPWELEHSFCVAQEGFREHKHTFILSIFSLNIYVDLCSKTIGECSLTFAVKKTFANRKGSLTENLC